LIKALFKKNADSLSVFLKDIAKVPKVCLI
jgi:hypothetical protein